MGRSDCIFDCVGFDFDDFGVLFLTTVARPDQRKVGSRQTFGSGKASSEVQRRSRGNVFLFRIVHIYWKPAKAKLNPLERSDHHKIQAWQARTRVFILEGLFYLDGLFWSLLETRFVCFITVEKGGVARAKGVGEKEKEKCITSARANCDWLR